MTADVTGPPSRPGTAGGWNESADLVTLIADPGRMPPADADITESPLVQALVTRSRDLPEAERRRARRQLTAQVMDEKKAKTRSAAERLAVLTLVLVAVESGIWGSPFGEDGWFRVLGKALETLGESDIPGPLSRRTGS